MSKLAFVSLLVALLAVPVVAQQTPTSMAETYEAMADAILGMRQVESSFVQSMLDHHFMAAEMLNASGDFEDAAAHMALVANEGDNAIAGVRKRLLEGGHHFNAEGEEQGIFEPGFVIIDRKAKEALLMATTEYRKATTDEAREAAWMSFAKVAKKAIGY